MVSWSVVGSSDSSTLSARGGREGGEGGGGLSASVFLLTWLEGEGDDVGW